MTTIRRTKDEIFLPITQMGILNFSLGEREGGGGGRADPTALGCTQI
jgi:hypothetical protein